MAAWDHSSLGDIEYNTHMHEPTQQYHGNTSSPYTLASGFSAVHCNLTYGNIRFNSGATATITGVTRSGAIATYTTSSAHGLVDGNRVSISGTTNFNDSDLDNQTVDVQSSTTFNMTLSAETASNETGITATVTLLSGIEVPKDDIGLSFTFETPSSINSAEGWEGKWNVAVTSVNIHGEESYLRKADISEVTCDDSTKSPIISLVHSSLLDITEIKYFKVYMNYSDSEIYYLQMICDIQNKEVWSSTGGTKRPADFVSDSSHATWCYQTPSDENLIPNEVNSYESETQIPQEDAENEGTMTAQYKCSVVADNHLYVGNIKQNGVIMSDKMIKSPRGKPGILPASNDITLVSNDGDEIIDLHYFKNKLLQFKKNRVYVIGTDEGDYLDEIFESVGIKHKSQVVTTSVGIFWVNENGLYGYNGEGLTNFTEGKIAQKKWKESISSWVLYDELSPSIGYLRKENKLIIWPSTYNTTLTSHLYPADYSDGMTSSEHDNLKRISTNEYGYIYDLDGKRWSMIYKGVDGETLTSSIESPKKDNTSRMYGISEDSYMSSVTNFSYDINNNLIWGAPNADGFRVYKWDDSPSTTSGIGNNERDYRIITKDFDFDAPSIKKKIFKVYVTFKSTFEKPYFSNRKELTQGLYSPPNVKAYYSINGDNTWVEFSTTKSKNYDSTGFITPFGSTWSSYATLPLTLIGNVDNNNWTTSSALQLFGANYPTILTTGNIFRINDEQFLVTNDHETNPFKVQRAYNNTEISNHDNGSEILLSKSSWIEAELKPSNSINNINSIAFKFATNKDDNTAVPRGFVINDITVIYRPKRVI